MNKPDEHYREIVEQAHKLLDQAGVPSAVGAECDDPDCQSLLIHRLKTLLNLHAGNSVDFAEKPVTM